ncbi:TetR/AcrR family transcriptional regulator [Cellulosimicrobium protaetiae]|uniref:TetR/AcrR family transcriptional regulator n=1 Tax=Cellulosimicrobium protaetiae TaxID=2587808 RepID=A0A6M5UIE0_9MICO|nr:TetR/AcrR family transcriptional regulator [Cellulosimicrobium protaetiae]QJW37075.1 TetR/AcrR family transcriptional regulator [Cellulosimicrobium protaetiae]
MARPRLHDAALRDRLLDVTSRTISAHGEAAVTVRAVAKAAGTSPSAVYALFGSRDDLVAAVSAEGFRRFAQHLGAVARTDDPAADLAALGVAYRGFALADPHFYAVMFARGVRPGADRPRAVEEATFLVLRDAVARLVPDATTADDVALGLWGLVHGLVSLELAGLVPGDDAERAARYGGTLAAVGPGLVGRPGT